MRKRKEKAENASTHLSLQALQNLEDKGYKYVQVKGMTLDKHFDYVEPHFMVLIPMKELPTDPAMKDIYEPISSDLLKSWAKDDGDDIQILISNSAKFPWPHTQ